jgi:hypothetical protein
MSRCQKDEEDIWRQQMACCKEPPNYKPLTIILSCTEPSRAPEVEPMRSTFCFPESTMQYKSMNELMTLREQWATFERVENYNSIVSNTLANIVPTEAGVQTPEFYQFRDSHEKTSYKLGQLAHTVAYPDVADFLKPYSYKPIQYVSSVISTMTGTNYPPVESTICSNVVPPLPTLDYDELLRNRVGLGIYVRVSTQLAQFPKSPYKFSSNEEYITYKEYKRILLC